MSQPNHAEISFHFGGHRVHELTALNDPKAWSRRKDCQGSLGSRCKGAGYIAFFERHVVAFAWDYEYRDAARLQLLIDLRDLVEGIVCMLEGVIRDGQVRPGVWNLGEVCDYRDSDLTAAVLRDRIDLDPRCVDCISILIVEDQGRTQNQ